MRQAHRVGQRKVVNSFVAAQVGFCHQTNSPDQRKGVGEARGEERHQGKEDLARTMTEVVNAMRETSMVCQLTAAR